VLAIPRLSRRIASSERVLGYTLGALGFSIFTPFELAIGQTADKVLDVYFDTWAFEVTLPDLLTWLLLASHARRQVPRALPGPLWLPRLLYFAIMLASVMNSQSTLISLYPLLKLVRAYLFFAVLVAEFRSLSRLRACLNGLGIATALQGGFALLQRYAWGVERPAAMTGSSNILSLLLNMIGPLAFALYLSGQAKRVALLAIFAYVACPVLGESRAGSALLALGLTTVAVGSLLRSASVRKLRLLGGGTVAGVIPTAVFLPGLLSREKHFIDWAWIERLRLSAAAKSMIRDHPWGVGANMFGWIANTDGYYRIAGVNTKDRLLLVHNYYYLVTAELGWIGAGALVLVLASVIVMAARGACAGGVRGELALGALVGLVAYAIDAWFEMSQTSRAPMYAFWLLAAVAATATLRERSETSPVVGV
jgi:hypothetical protein